MIPLRSNAITEIMDNKCGFLDNEIDEIRIRFTPTVQHSQLWTCYIFYLMCIAQLSDINHKDKQEFDTFINKIEGTELKFGSSNKEILSTMEEYKFKIFKLKKLIRYSRIYGEDNVIMYCISHMQEYNVRSIVTMTDEQMDNMKQFFVACVRFKHIDFDGNHLLDESFVDLFGWTYSFVDHIIQFVATQNCLQFLLFVRDFQSTYRSYIRFEEFFQVYRHDHLYKKYKKNMMKYFDIDVDWIELSCAQENEQTLADIHVH